MKHCGRGSFVYFACCDTYLSTWDTRPEGLKARLTPADTSLCLRISELFVGFIGMRKSIIPSRRKLSVMDVAMLHGSSCPKGSCRSSFCKVVREAD